MKPSRLRSILLPLLLCAAPMAGRAADADADLDAIKKRLAPFVTLRGGFEQNKRIRVLKKPLRSEGDFVLLKDKGVLWRSAKPVASTLRIRRDDISQVKDGKASVLVSMKGEPALGLIGKVLFAVFSADVDALKHHFEFVRAAPPDARGRWEAVLRPRDAMVRKVVERIDLAGGRVVETLTLREVNGDSSELRFKDIVEDRPLSQEEKTLFE